MSVKDADDFIRRARALGNSEQARALYSQWAETYDRDVESTLKFIGAQRIAELLVRYLPARASRIIDLGCGTGSAGVALSALGFHNVDGLDLSPAMLAVAKTKGVYRNHIAADLNKPLDLAEHSYDGMISAGTFTSGHVDARALAAVLPALKPGGIAAVVIADAVWQSGGFASALDALSLANAIETRHHVREPITKNGGPEGHYLVFARVQT